jgi:Family of unknown function (DUF5991)
MWSERRRAGRALAALLLVACVAQTWAVGPRAWAFAPAAAADELDAWVGEYVFEEDGGRTAGGSAIYVVHQLNVTREGDALKARLESNGYQTYAAFECEARVAAGRLKLFFVRHADENVFLRGDYRAGDLLLTLARAAATRRPRLLTYWGKFRPQFRRPRQGRVFFRRVDSRQ